MMNLQDQIENINKLADGFKELEKIHQSFLDNSIQELSKEEVEKVEAFRIEANNIIKSAKEGKDYIAQLNILKEKIK